MRHYIEIIENAQTAHLKDSNPKYRGDEKLSEARTFTLVDSLRKILADPSRHDIKNLLKKFPILRGIAIKEPGSSDFIVLVWKANLLSHWRVLNDLLNHQGYDGEYVSFKVGITEESLREDRYWRDAVAHDCGDYFVMFHSKLDPFSIPKLASIFGK